MFCKNCGAELLETSKFCLNCGTKVEAPAAPAAPVAAAEPAPSPVSPTPKKNKTPAFIIVLIIILSLLLVGEAAFIVYDELIAPDSYSESDEEDKDSSSKNTSSGNGLNDNSSDNSTGNSSDNSSDFTSSDNTSSNEEKEFSPSVISGSWYLSSFVDSEGNEITPQVNAFLYINLTADGKGDGLYAVYEGRNENRTLSWKYKNPLSNGSHYYELEATNGDSYALCYNPETNQLYMDYYETEDTETTRYYSLIS